MVPDKILSQCNKCGSETKYYITAGTFPSKMWNSLFATVSIRLPYIVLLYKGLVYSAAYIHVLRIRFVADSQGKDTGRVVGLVEAIARYGYPCRVKETIGE